MVSDTVVIAAIVAVSSTCAPLFLAYLTAQQRRKERKEDFERQDKVAERAAEVARLLLEKDEEENEAAPGQNGYVSAAMRSEIETLDRAIAVSEENLQLRIAAGHLPSEELIRAIRYQRDRLNLLKMRLADRERPVEEQLKIDENDLEQEIKKHEEDV